MKRGYFLLVLALAFFAKAGDEIEDAIYLKSASYDYQLTNTDGNINCIGNLELVVSHPEWTKWIMVAYSRPFNTDSTGLNLIGRSVKEVTNVGTTTITMTDFRWGIYFRLVAISENDEQRVSSPLYCINDYMNPEDLVAILNQHGAVDVSKENTIEVWTNGTNLNVDTAERIKLDVYTLSGMQILSEEVSGMASFNLDNIPLGVLIVRYQTANEVFTKKIRLK